MTKNDDTNLNSSNKSNTVRLHVDIPYSTLRQLLLWSASRGETKNGWSRTILVLRCEENSPKVNQWLEREAGQLNVSQEELETAILTRMGFDFEAYRKSMLNL